MRRKRISLYFVSSHQSNSKLCYLRLYFGIETVSCRLSTRMARMDMDWDDLKKLGKLFQFLMLCLRTSPKKISCSVLPGETCYFLSFSKAKTCLPFSWILKITDRFRLYLRTESVSCRLLLQMARMDMDFGKIGPTFSIFSAMPAKITPKIFWFVLRDEICLISSSQLYGSISMYGIKGTKLWLQ